jgi:threonine/homoserine/homoserine lactone efflux protein
MNVLRALSILSAGLVLIASPVVLDPNNRGLPGWIALAGLVVTTLSAASFVYVAATAPRLRRRPQERKRATLMLLIPFAGALAVLTTHDDPIQLLGSGVLLAFTVLLLMGVWVPDALGLGERRARRRMRREPAF